MKEFILDIFKTIIQSAVIVLIIITFIAIPVNVVGNSMYPNLRDGDFGFGAIFTKWGKPQRFDIVIIDNDMTNEKIVKRIIGLPNETIEYKDNKLYVNGEYIKEPFIYDNYTHDFKITLVEDEYYCLGDNRQYSKDSRFYGPFNKKDFVSRKMMVVYPFNNFGIK